MTTSTFSAAMRRPLRTAMSFCQITAVAGDDLEAVGLQALDQRVAELAVDGLQRGLQERPAVAKVEHADADGAMREMREHRTSTHWLRGGQPRPASNGEKRQTLPENGRITLAPPPSLPQ